MDDLIKRQDAIDAIDHYIGEVKNIPMGTAFKEGVKDGYCRIRSIIMSLPPAQQLIPVTERLPEKDGDYLAFARWTDDEKYEIQVISFDSCLNGFGFVQEYFDRETLGSLGTETTEADVIAWMPLPKPYKAPAPERDCEHCVHRKDKGCEKWDCEFERKTT